MSAQDTSIGVDLVEAALARIADLERELAKARANATAEARRKYALAAERDAAEREAAGLRAALAETPENIEHLGQGEGMNRAYKHAIIVPVSDDAQMTISNGELDWCLRYAPLDRHDALVAATIIASFDYLINECSQKEALRRLRLLRQARHSPPKV